MRIKQITTEKQAVAGVIEALLLVALIAIVISMIQLQYIPQIMEQREADHMDQVSNQFAYLKSLIDIQAVTGSLGTEAPLAYVPMNAQLTLGSGQLPYFVTAPAAGEIQVDDNVQSYITTGPYPLFCGGKSNNTFSLAGLRYDADNSYFIDQTYILEGGGIILSQPLGKSVMRADPCISVETLLNEIKVRIYLPRIIGYAGKNSTSGIGQCFIRTNYSKTETYTTPGPSYPPFFSIKSEYLDAWNESMHRIFADEIKNHDVNVSIVGDVVKIIALNQGKPFNIEISIVDINCQIGPGWVL